VIRLDAGMSTARFCRLIDLPAHYQREGRILAERLLGRSLIDGEWLFREEIDHGLANLTIPIFKTEEALRTT